MENTKFLCQTCRNFVHIPEKKHMVYHPPEYICGILRDKIEFKFIERINILKCGHYEKVE